MDPLSINVTISIVRILFLKHFNSLKSGSNFPMSLGPKGRRECLPYVTVLCQWQLRHKTALIILVSMIYEMSLI